MCDRVYSSREQSTDTLQTVVASSTKINRNQYAFVPIHLGQLYLFLEILTLRRKFDHD